MNEEVLTTPTLCFQSDTSSESRFRAFMEWAKPGGDGGFNRAKEMNLDWSRPWFSLPEDLLQDGDNSSRCWFIRHEFINDGQRKFQVSRNKGVIWFDDSRLIPDGVYLGFAKSFLNVLLHFRNYRSKPKTMLKALIILERSIRLVNAGESDPWRINKTVFYRAGQLLQESTLGDSGKYEVGKDLELIAGMLQGGYRSNAFPMEGKGFQLLDKSFVFKSPIPPTPRKRVIDNLEDFNQSRDESRLTNDEVASIGVAYRVAKSRLGNQNIRTFIAAIGAFALTTVSMRMSDLIRVQRDCLYLSSYKKGVKSSNGSDAKRLRIRIFRPKTQQSQELPIAKRLWDLARESHDSLSEYSIAASNAFEYYIANYGEDFNAIDHLYIPPHLRDLFEKEFLVQEEIARIFGWEATHKEGMNFNQWIRNRVEVAKFVDEPGDVWAGEAAAVSSRTKFVKVRQIEIFSAEMSSDISRIPKVNRELYISRSTAARWLGINREATKLKELFKQVGKPGVIAISSRDLQKALLTDFKKNRPTHWPYLDKDRKIRLDKALLVYFPPLCHKNAERLDNRRHKWWCPSPVPGDRINHWLNRDIEGKPAWLFYELSIRTSEGQYPSIGMHALRKKHQTEALIAGASERFIDILAGRQSGAQSDFYDLRTVHELLLGSIRTIAPEDGITAIGSAVDQIPEDIPIVEREAMLFDNAVPRHITEIGGCTADWSVDPCKMYGDCIRCDRGVWRKGDVERLVGVEAIYKENIARRDAATERIERGDDFPSIVAHREQALEAIERCDEIFRIENDPGIALGTLVTFDAAPTAVTQAQRSKALREGSPKKYGPSRGE